jgi:hypothetical protein
VEWKYLYGAIDTIDFLLPGASQQGCGAQLFRAGYQAEPGWLLLCWFCPSTFTTAKVSHHP